MSFDRIKNSLYKIFGKINIIDYNAILNSKLTYENLNIQSK